MNPILIIGAGPSECQVDYSNLPENLDTFGMNLAWRRYPERHWEPTYFGCFDRRVAQCLEQQYKLLIESDTAIKHFYMIHKVSHSTKLTTLKLHGKVGDFSMDFDSFGYAGCTGACCAQVAAIRGHTRILLVGMDGYKTEIVDGAVKDGNYLKIVDAPRNSDNYADPDYQFPGLKYNPPNEAKFHRPAWKGFAKFSLKNNIEVVNCSWGDVADFYPRSTLCDEMEAMRK